MLSNRGIEVFPRLTDSRGYFLFRSYGVIRDTPRHNEILDACRRNQFEVLKKLVNDGVILNCCSMSLLHTPVMYCCENGNSDMLKYVLLNGASADNYCLIENYTGLYYAVRENHAYCVTVLLAHGVRTINATTHYEGNTALWLASSKGRLDMVKQLVEAGANTDLKNKNGETPRAIAMKNGHAAVVMYLDPKELKWRRRFPYAAVLHSIKGALSLNYALRVLQCYDMAREIGSFL